MCKVFENTFRAVNIALVNELLLLCDRMGISVWEVLDAAHTKPFGIMPFLPGPGVGGHCIPLDPHYLEWKAKEYNFNTHFIALAGEINRSMPEFVVQKCARVLNQQGVALSKSKILVLGVAYKRDLDDYRESPRSHRDGEAPRDRSLLELPRSLCACLLPRPRLTLESVPLTEDTLADADLILILTDHRSVDYGFVCSHAKAILDTRNATKAVKNGERVTLL